MELLRFLTRQIMKESVSLESLNQVAELIYQGSGLKAQIKGDDIYIRVFNDEDHNAFIKAWHDDSIRSHFDGDWSFEGDDNTGEGYIIITISDDLDESTSPEKHSAKELEKYLISKLPGFDVFVIDGEIWVTVNNLNDKLKIINAWNDAQKELNIENGEWRFEGNSLEGHVVLFADNLTESTHKIIKEAVDVQRCANLISDISGLKCHIKNGDIYVKVFNTEDSDRFLKAWNSDKVRDEFDGVWAFDGNSDTGAGYIVVVLDDVYKFEESLVYDRIPKGLWNEMTYREFVNKIRSQVDAGRVSFEQDDDTHTAKATVLDAINNKTELLGVYDFEAGKGAIETSGIEILENWDGWEHNIDPDVYNKEKVRHANESNYHYDERSKHEKIATANGGLKDFAHLRAADLHAKAMRLHGSARDHYMMMNDNAPIVGQKADEATKVANTASEKANAMNKPSVKEAITKRYAIHVGPKQSDGSYIIKQINSPDLRYNYRVGQHIDKDGFDDTEGRGKTIDGGYSVKVERNP